MSKPPVPPFELDPSRAWLDRTITPNDLIDLSRQLGETGTRVGITRFTFSHCVFEGPMVLFLWSSYFNAPVFDLRNAPVDAMLWPREGSTIGAIALIECLVENCLFRNVGIAAHPSQIVEFKAKWWAADQD